jgi:hypothetical protein
MPHETNYTFWEREEISMCASGVETKNLPPPTNLKKNEGKISNISSKMIIIFKLYSVILNALGQFVKIFLNSCNTHL